ncbi:MAG TPA: flavodoxin [Methanobacteriaceae archaeon]|nr:flavodoxin [Methanobacteriaceae archaeon]
MKILVVFYSRSDNTRRVAAEIRTILDCDIEEVIDTQNRSGTLGYIRSVIHAIMKTPAIIEEIKNDPANYDLLIMGTPVWSGKMSTPTRAYIAQNHDKFNNMAFFCTAIGPNFDGTFSEMEKLSETSPLAKMGLRAKEINDGSYKSKVAQFVEKIH